MNKRFIQAHREARWTLGLTLLYLLGLVVGCLPAGQRKRYHWFTALVRDGLSAGAPGVYRPVLADGAAHFPRYFPRGR